MGDELTRLKRLAAFPEQNPNPLLELDRDKTVTYLNPAAKKLFPGLETQGAAHPLLKGLDWTREKDAGKSVQQVEYDGARYELRFDASPGDSYTRIYLADVSARVEAERMQEQFIHNVTHELRTPLTSIDQSVKLILDGILGECPPKQKRFLQIADRGANHLRAMINDLLDMTRADTGKLTIEPRRMELKPLIADVAETMRLSAQTKNIEIFWEAAKDLPPLLADPVRIRQVLINLIDNALKFVQAKGRITVRAALCAEETGKALVSVEDTGIGIPAEALKSIFDRLYQVRAEEDKIARKGLGLGLFISKQLINRHGGRIWVESEPGKGSVFRFTVPVFSMESLLEPVFRVDRDGTGALVAFEIYGQKNYLTEHTARSLILETRDTLRRCLAPGEVVLPEMSAPGEEGLLFALTPGEHQAAEALAARALELFSKSHLIRSNRLAPAARHELVSLRTDRDRPTSLAERAERVSDIVRRAIAARAAETA